MPAKKATTTAAAPKKAATAPTHPSYKDMIKEAILTLKERNGSSRQAIKKYIQGNFKPSAASTAIFDSQFNKALRSGVEKGDFEQPKGPSGPVKLHKKVPAAKTEDKKTPAAKDTKAPAKKETAKKETVKKSASKAAPAKPKTTKAATTKKAAPVKKTTTKANTSSKRKTPTAAPAIVPVEKVLGKTKSGRVTKTTAKPAAPAKKAAPKKAAAKKATPKKTATPKKAAAAPAEA